MDNIITFFRAIAVVEMVSWIEINFAKIFLVVIHEREFKTSTTYPFPCLIFWLSKDVGVPILHCDRLYQQPRKVDIGLIRDKANVMAPVEGPRLRFLHLVRTWKI